MTEFLFSRQGDDYLPTDAAGSPWHPSVLHGGAGSALMGYAIERIAPPGYAITRVTMDLVRPLPKAPLSVASRIARDGARLKVIEVDVSAGGKLVCRAGANLARTQPFTPPDYAPVPHPPPAGPEGIPSFDIQAMLDAKGTNIPRGLHSRVEVRSQVQWGERGRNTSWLRLPLDIVDGEALTPFSRACALSDLGNGVAQLGDGKGSGMINSDITLAIFRLPVGEWVCFDAEAQVQPTGTGVVHSTIYDTTGSFGHVVQSVMLNREFAG